MIDTLTIGRASRVYGQRPQRRSRCVSSRRVIHRAAEVPPPIIDEFLGDMAVRMSRTPEARACIGLSFTFVSRDVDVMPARYEVRRGGVVAVQRGGERPSTFTFVSDADTFDSVLRGRTSALVALVARRIHLDGSFSRVRALLRMLPAVQNAYEATREDMIAQYRQYEFAF
jgi:hypothetical protein